MIQFRITLAFLFLVAVFSHALPAQESTKLAEVNGQPVSLAVVHHLLDQTFGIAPSVSVRNERSAATIAAGLEQCINREVILQHLQSGKSAIPDEQADRLVEEVKSAVELSHPTFDAYLKSINLSKDEHRRELIWNRAWRKYARTHVTEAHLEKQFQKRKKALDGTQIRVAQILWKTSNESTLAKANEVQKQLAAKSLTWNEAVKLHSESASAKKNGDLGWIKFSGPMPREFSKVAFALNVGEFSKPFASSFGIHLVHCLDVKPGSKTFGDVAIELRESETKRLFALVAERHRPNAKIERMLNDMPAPDSDSTR